MYDYYSLVDYFNNVTAVTIIGPARTRRRAGPDPRRLPAHRRLTPIHRK
jgi:hypothetical protein